MDVEGEITHLLAYMGIKIPFHDFFQGHLDFTIYVYHTVCYFTYLKYHMNVYMVTPLLRHSSSLPIIYKWIPYSWEVSVFCDLSSILL